VYLEFYGLDALPFELSPDPKYLLLTESHREALANLQYGISARKSLTLITGEAGTGKTTLINAALSSASCRDARIVHLSNSMLSRDEFVEFLAARFMLSPEAERSKARLLAELERELLQRRAQGVTTALVIDEAQCLERELLEEIRLLSNIETPSEKLLPLVLVGQPEFAERLNLPSLRQLKQRVALRCELGTLTAAETAAYVTGRIRIAGGDGSTVFTRDALEEVHRFSHGIPRTISVICDNALVNGFAAGVKPITAALVRQVCTDFDFNRTQPAPVDGRQLAADAPVQSPPQRDVEASAERRSAEDAQPMFNNFSRKRRFSFF
jgi:general secretion pathway protein A